MDERQLLSAILFRLDDINYSMEKMKKDNENIRLLIEKTLLQQENINDKFRNELDGLKKEVIALQKAS